MGTEWICSTSDELAVDRRVGTNTTTFWGGREREDSYQAVPILSELGGWPCRPQWRGRWWRRAERREEEGGVCALLHEAGGLLGTYEMSEQLKIREHEFLQSNFKTFVWSLVVFNHCVRLLYLKVQTSIKSAPHTEHSFLPGFFPKMLLFPHFAAPPL